LLGKGGKFDLRHIQPAPCARGIRP
jgi:hypothetical protein